MNQIQPPCEHTCWLVQRDKRTGEKVVPDIATERVCPACQYVAGFAAGKQAQCDHHRAFSLEDGVPLLCPTCGATVPEKKES